MIEPVDFAKNLQSATNRGSRPLRLAKVTNTTENIGDTFVTMADGVEVPARYLGSYQPEINDIVQVYVTSGDVLILGSVKKASDFGSGSTDLTGAYVYFDAGGDVNAARPTEPEGANFIWVNVPFEPTNIGPNDLWEDTERDFTITPIQENEIANNSIVVDKIVNGAIARVKIAEAAINEALIDIGAVTETKIADDAITTPKIVSNAIIGDHIQARQVDAFHVVAGAITANEIASRTITADRIRANELTANEILANTITANEIAANTITAN